MDSVILTIMAGGISALFGVLVTQWRAADAEQKTRIRSLEDRLEKRDGVLHDNTESMKQLAGAVDDMAGMMRDIMDYITSLRERHVRDDDRYNQMQDTQERER